MFYSFDIDLDFSSRDEALKLLEHTPATIIRENEIVKHTTGIYVTKVPIDPVTGHCSLDYQAAEKLGYFKLDFLNVSVYSLVTDPDHLDCLLEKEPSWNRLLNKNFVSQVIHISNHFRIIRKMPEPIDSIEKLAMLLAIIRPGKKHLIGLPWNEVAKTVWEKSKDGYSFKKAHGIAYATLVKIHMNLIEERESNGKM